MDGVRVNRKRPVPAYNGFTTAKRFQEMNYSYNEDSMFVSGDDNDKDDNEATDLLLGNDHDDDMAFITNSVMTRSVRPPSPSTLPQLHPQRLTVNNPQPTSSRFPVQQRTISATGARTGIGARSSSASSMNPGTGYACVVPENVSATNSTEIEIKDEKDQSEEPDWLKGVVEKERVKIYVGKRNEEKWAKRADLKKSPVLESYIIDDPTPGQISYIMRPQLASTDPNLFESVVQYLHRGEYAPLLLEITSRDGEIHKIWDGMREEAQYAKELVRTGKVYNLAQKFQVEGLAEYIYKKITEVDVKKFPLGSIVELAGILFKDKWAKEKLVLSTQDSQPQERDKLEVWLITHIASNFKQVMQSHQAEFWRVENQTKKKLFLAQVLEEVACHYRATGGTIADAVIELN